jgi:transcriptional regulator of acetoin/glycerol metabolism
MSTTPRRHELRGFRAEIAKGWRRASLSGLDPGAKVENVPVGEIDPHSRLMVAARPVLDGLAEQLAETRFSVLLADRTARIVDRRFGQLRLARSLDEVRAAPGHQYLEQITGTNALATAFEVRKGVTVNGEEHFLDSLKQFCCYGHPIMHPVTGRLVGVIDLTGYARDATPLLVPVLKRAVQDIEQHLLDGARISEQHMLAAFQARNRRTNRALLVLGDDLTLANQHATELLDGPAQAALRELAIEPGPQDRQLTLPDGRQLSVRCAPVQGAAGSVLAEVISIEGAASVPRGGHARMTATDQTARYRTDRTRVILTGEPGSGRTWSALQLAHDSPVRRVSGEELDEAASYAQLRTELDDWPGLVLVPDIQLLSAVASARLARLMDDSVCWFALTAPPPSVLDDEHRGLAARCPAHMTIAPLRARSSEIGPLADNLLRQLRPDSDLRLSADAVRALSNCPWPGNVGELKAVMTYTASRHTRGVLTVADLPPQYQRAVRARGLSTMQHAEFDAIVTALRNCRGNKVQAAAELGIGRTTLYRKMRALGLTR